MLCAPVLHLGHVEAFVDLLGNGLDLGSQFLLDQVELLAVLVGDEVNGQSEVTESTRAPDTVEIRLCVLREVKVDNHID